MQKLLIENQRIDTGVGYFYVYDSKHPLAPKSGGKIYVHRYITSIKIGRWVTIDEVVHHIDENKQNNTPENLEVMTNAEHIMHHHMERGYVSLESVCDTCGVVFNHYQARIDKSMSGKVFCSRPCLRISLRKFELTKEELTKLVWEFPITKIAIMYGVSDVAIHKRCKILGVVKPPNGVVKRKK